MSDREVRRMQKHLSEKARRAFDILLAYEQAEIRIVPALGAGLECDPIQFVVFACLGTKRRREELRVDITETIFIKRYRRRAENLFDDLSKEGIAATLLIILPDLEPSRTWGWKKPQEETTFECQCMIEEAHLPRTWTATVWSELEAHTGLSDQYMRSHAWSRSSAPPLLLREETRFFMELGSRHPDILVNATPLELAQRQIAAYANEGIVLEHLFPQAILLQADSPVDRKDTMFGLLRTNPLGIVHPWTP